jgi:hypothetical protein
VPRRRDVDVAGFTRAEGAPRLWLAPGFEGFHRGTVRAELECLPTRVAYLRKLAWLMRRMARAMPYLGYVVIGGVRAK